VAETKTSQANPMTIWCLLVMALVTTVLAKERRTRRLQPENFVAHQKIEVTEGNGPATIASDEVTDGFLLLWR
jgi:hypothetical protein